MKSGRRTYVLLTAVQDRLITPTPLANSRQGLDDAQAYLLALLLLVDGDVLDVADAAETAEELALDEDAADADDRVRGLVEQDDGVIRAGARALCMELCLPALRAWVGDNGEDLEDGEVAAFVVR